MVIINDISWNETTIESDDEHEYECENWSEIGVEECVKMRMKIRSEPLNRNANSPIIPVYRLKSAIGELFNRILSGFVGTLRPDEPM